jgi:type IV pilus assembly protein PilV
MRQLSTITPMKTNNIKRHTLNRHHQSGLSLIESLVGLLVLALGILGLAGVQARLLVETRTAVHRAIAVGLIEDITNRMALNRDAAFAGEYSLNFSDEPQFVDCFNKPCTAVEMADFDKYYWRASVKASLPNAQAKVFSSSTDPRQIGIAVGWVANESERKDGDTTKYNAPFTVTAASHGVTCPSNSICHVVYVQP